MKSLMPSIKTLVALSVLSVLTVSAQAAPKDAEPSLSSIRSEHVRAIDLALKGKTTAALTLLNKLSEYKVEKGEKDRIFMSLGRIYYQEQDYDRAKAAYDKVEERGSSWIEALSEKAWIHMNNEQPQDVIATLKTVTSPVFKDTSRTEPFFLMSLAQLRVCDHKALFKTLETFKNRYREPIKSWESDKSPENLSRLKEASETIQKMNLVEAEAIQRLYMEEDGKSHGSIPKIQKQANELSFPHTDEKDKEVWADEVNNFRVSLRGCPKPQESGKLAKEGSGE